MTDPADPAAALAADLSADPAADLATLRACGLFDTAWVLARNPDLAESGTDPLWHFHRFGWREGRWPNPYFDPAYYLARNPDVRAAGTDPLLHYAERGEAQGRRPVPWFDPAWYRARYGVPHDTLCLAHFLAHRRRGRVSPVPEFDAGHYLRLYPDVAAAGMDPFEHYLVRGAAEGRRPAPDFDPDYYRVRHLGGQPGQNPLLHYIAHRGEPGVHTVAPADEPSLPREVRRHARPGPHFEEVRPLAPDAPRRAKLLAFYLPQFHPVPENDAWWGRGFTEWTNVARGLPRFAGHYQPRIPRDLGHYRLDGTGVLKRQAEMARGAGLHGFVFYFYWFNGRRLLASPLEALLADSSVDLPFCLMWANENWTRRWDGGEGEVLISQDYREADEAALVAEFARHMRDGRYIRLGGRPVLMVYRAGLVPGGAATVARWRRCFRDAHGEDPFLVMAQSFADRDPRPLGFDAAVEFPPHKLTGGLRCAVPELRLFDHEFTARVHRYEDVVRASLDEPEPPYPLIRTAVPSWDNDARRQGAGTVLHGATPQAYQDWLQALIRRARERPVGGEALVCVNAWNEWAEGAYLEPDVHFGGAYLNATARAVSGAVPPGTVGRLLLVGHDAFPAGAQHLLLHLGRRLVRAHGVEVRFVLLGGGRLLPEYEAVAPTAVAADPAALAAAVDDARARGIRRAVVNSAAAAPACEALDAAGIAPVLLVHELPGLLRSSGLVDAARRGAGAARRVVFACAHVRDRFQELVALPPGRAVVLPQGAYRPPRPGDADAARGMSAQGAPPQGATPQGATPQGATPQGATRGAIRAELGIPDDAVLAVGLGYGDLRKGFDLFVQVWRALHRGPGHRAPGHGASGHGASEHRASGHREAEHRGERRPDRDHLPPVHLLWVGDLDPVLHATLGAELAAAAATGSFHHLPYRPDAADLLAAADVYLLTSREDPFPTAVLEALHAGLPAVAFEDSGGVPDLLRELEAGTAVPLGDARAMGEAALALVRADDPARRARLAEAARRRFDFARYAAELLRLAQPGWLPVSVAVPSYNYARFLAGRLHSVFAQTYPVREVIVLDDASRDGSPAVARAAARGAGREVRVRVNARNSGSPFRQWRRAAEEAQGEWLWIAEADDLAEPRLLESLAAAASADPAVVLAFCDSRPIDAAGADLAPSYKPYYAEIEPGALAADATYDGAEFLSRFMGERNPILNASAVLWRRSALLAALERCGEELEGYSVAGDWRLYAEVLSAGGRVAYVAEPLNLHRRHGASATHALAAGRHVEEIGRVHRWLARRLGGDPALRQRQRAYRRRVKAQLDPG